MGTPAFLFSALLSIVKATPAMDNYSDYNVLSRNEKEGVDYLILSRKTASPLAVIAPHAGGIEPGTGEIADAIAGRDYSFYAFKGIKKTGNRVLHIASDRFDEPEGRKIAHNADVVLTIHGCKEKEKIVFLGGKNQAIIERIRSRLIAAGFHAVISPRPGLQGQSTENICNRCRSGQGVQLEISRGLREALFLDLSQRSLRRQTLLFNRFVETLRTALSS